MGSPWPRCSRSPCRVRRRRTTTGIITIARRLGGAVAAAITPSGIVIIGEDTMVGVTIAGTVGTARPTPYGWGPAHAATDFMASGLNRGQLG